jgi:hypothetical protein
LKNADPYQPTIASIELTISGSTVVVPECVASLFSTRTMKDVRVSASWYHDTSISGLPPYLSVKLYHPGNEAAPFRPGYWLLFNLSTARLLSVKVVVPGTDNSAQLVPVDLAARCSARELQEFSERRLRPNTALERSRGR